MDNKSLKDIHKAINENIETIKVLFNSAKAMQESIPKLTDDKDREIMEGQFKKVAEAINDLMESTTKLFDLIMNEEES